MNKLTGEFESRTRLEKTPTATQYANLIDNFRDKVIENLPASVALCAYYPDNDSEVMINFGGRNDGILKSAQGLVHLAKDTNKEMEDEDADN